VNFIFETQSTFPHTTSFPALRLINSRTRVALTVREGQTVYLITECWNDHDIARALDLNESTLKKSLMRMYEKLGVSGRTSVLRPEPLARTVRFDCKFSRRLLTG
jgi:DNA-binding NarL/FixJ family response regulator